MPESAIGIDLGGTHLRVGVVSADGELSAFERRELPGEETAEAIASQICTMARGTGAVESAQGVGLAIAATLSSAGEILEGPHNLPPDLNSYPLADQVANELGLPCRVGNDANLAALGEATFGAAAGIRRALVVTLGTGVGAGILLDGKLVTGAHGSASELGLWRVLDPSTDAYAPVETLAAPGAVMERLGRQGEDLFALVDSGDEEAAAAAELMFRLLGLLVTNVHLLLDLELVVLTGGLAAAGERVRDGVQESVERLCPPAYQFDLPIRLGALPADAVGVIGAASLWLRQPRQ